MADLEDVKELVLWARKNGIVLARAKSGAVELDILAMGAPSTLPSEAEAKQTLYEQFGGELLAAAEQDAKGEDVYDEDD
jgi:hypothetical protein